MDLKHSSKGKHFYFQPGSPKRRGARLDRISACPDGLIPFIAAE
jgi:hypothetical protein